MSINNDAVATVENTNPSFDFELRQQTSWHATAGLVWELTETQSGG
jgi:hypothetical protein